MFGENLARDVLYKKIPTMTLVVAVVVTSFLAFSPNQIASALGVREFREANRGSIGVIFIASTAMLIAYGVSLLSNKIKSNLALARMHERRKQLFSNLTPAEKEYVARFFECDMPCIYFDKRDHVAIELRRKKILELNSMSLNFRGERPYALSEWAKSHLLRFPEDLSGG